MDRTRRTDARGARRRGIAGLTLAAGLALGCHNLTLSPDRVIALEIPNIAPKVNEGDTLRLVVRPLNAAGQPVTGAVVTWAVLDTGVVAIQLESSGLVRGLTAGTTRVQARADDLRSDPITVTVVKPTTG